MNYISETLSKKGKTLYDLSKAIEITHAHLYFIDKGQRLASRKVLKAIARYIEVDEKELVRNLISYTPRELLFKDWFEIVPEESYGKIIKEIEKSLK